MPHITSLITSQVCQTLVCVFKKLIQILYAQIRKAVKKKHTIPQFKLRYKPFFQGPVLSAPVFDGDFDQSDITPIPAGVLKVSLIECTRLNPELFCGDVYCTLAVGECR